MQSLGNDARREEKYFSRFRSCQTFINWFKSICFVIFCWIGNWVLSKCYQIPKELPQIDLLQHKRLFVRQSILDSIWDRRTSSLFSLLSIIRHDMLLFTLILDIGKKQFLPFKIFANSDVEGWMLNLRWLKFC